jgi:hypothetical protein
MQSEASHIKLTNPTLLLRLLIPDMNPAATKAAPNGSPQKYVASI